MPMQGIAPPGKAPRLPRRAAPAHPRPLELPLPRLTAPRLLAVGLAACAALPAAAVVAAAPAAAAERTSFIVTLRPGADPAATAREWRGRGAAVQHVYRHAVSGFSASMGASVAERLRGDRRVLRVERDGPVRAAGTQVSAPWGLDRIDQRIRPLDGTYTYASGAGGVTVYVIDTGVRATHTDFGGRVTAGYSAVADGRGTDDCNGHGTHVAGTAAGSRWGAAKAPNVVPIRVLDCQGSGTTSGVIAGLDFVAAHHAAGAPAVANLSLGGGASASLDTAVRNVVADGVAVVVAAGNEDTDACTRSPARVPEALTVAASTSTDVRASFSNWGSCVDLFGPGAGITSAHHASDTATATMSGTSMAAPHVAGIAALHLSADPSATPAAVHAAVNAAATTGVLSGTAGSPDRLAFAGLAPTEPAAPPATIPAAPPAPRATAEKRAVGVTWTAPADGGSAITGYTVRVHRATDGAVVKTVTVGGTTLATKVGGLTAGTAYNATVAAANAVGPGPWSPVSNTVTATR